MAHAHQLGRGLVQRPARGEVTAVLVAVRVAQHHFLLAAARVHPGAVERQLERAIDDRAAALEVGDRLEQRDDVHLQARARAGAQQSRLAQQHADFEQIGNRFAVRDHVVRRGARAEAAAAVGRRGQHRQLALHPLRVLQVRRAKRPRPGQLASQQRDARFLVQRGVVGLDAGAREQLRDRRLVLVRALPQIDRREMKAEQAHLPAQTRQPALGQAPRALRDERERNRVEVGGQLLRRGVGRALRARLQRGVPAGERLGARCKARVDSRQRAAVGLVAPVGRVVARRFGEREQRGGHLLDAGRDRQLLAEQVHLLEVVLENQLRLLLQRRGERRRGHVRVAVAIASDPAADGEERREPRRLREPEALLQGGLELLVQARQLGQEGHAEVGQAVGDLVLHFELGEPQHRRQPQAQHLASQSCVARRILRRGEQASDLALAIEDALALHLGRVRGQHRAHAGAAEPGEQVLAAQALGAQALERIGDAARSRRRSRFGVRAAPAVLLRVLGDIEQMRKEAERPHHVQRLLDVEGVEQRFELGLRFLRARLGAPERHRGLADELDAVEHLLADLLAYRVAQQPAQQAPVFAQQLLLRAFGEFGDCLHGRNST